MIPEEMHAGRFERPGEIKVTGAAVPEPGHGEVLIEVARAGICGTDIHILKGEYELARFPLTPGHEFAGTVVRLGPGVIERQLGERVTADPNIPCLTCSECHRSAFNQCLNLQVAGVTRDGAFARYLVLPERVVYPIGDIPFAEAALIEPLACVAWGLKRIRIFAGDTALVFGAGPMGCLLLQAVKSAGASRVAIVDLEPGRLKLARELGADLAITPGELERLEEFAPRGFEVVADATGVPSVLAGAIRHARAGGTIWAFGVAPDDALMQVSPYEFFRRDLSLVGSFAVNNTFMEAINLIATGAVKVAPLVSHVLPISQLEEGMRLAQHDPDRMKVQFDLS